MAIERSYRNYLLTILAIILAFSYVDRLALGLLLQDIKTDLSLSDTQLGFLTGLAFALFYSILGIPLARWADRGNRVTIIACTTALWSAAVALCGAAGNFIQLLLIRVGVAVGESGCMPSANSLIADYFTRAERPRAVARYMLGGPLSGVIGYFGAGWLNQLYGWRVTFVLLGLPGLVLAAIAWFTLREPRNKSHSAENAGPALAMVSAQPEIPSFKEVCAALWANITFRHLLISFALTSFFGIGIAQWKPTFFIRTYGLETAETGAWFAVIQVMGGLLGAYWGGELASRYAAREERLQLKGVAGVYCFIGLVSTCIYLSPNHYLAFALMALSIIGIYLTYGVIFATLQTLVPARMRAVALATTYLFANLIGMGLGPLAAGMFSDAFRPWAGDDSLRYALLALCPGYWWAAWHLWRASATVTRDLSIIGESIG